MRIATTLQLDFQPRVILLATYLLIPLALNVLYTNSILTIRTSALYLFGFHVSRVPRLASTYAIVPQAPQLHGSQRINRQQRGKFIPRIFPFRPDTLEADWLARFLASWLTILAVDRSARSLDSIGQREANRIAVDEIREQKIERERLGSAVTRSNAKRREKWKRERLRGNLCDALPRYRLANKWKSPLRHPPRIGSPIRALLVSKLAIGESRIVKKRLFLLVFLVVTRTFARLWNFRGV